MKPKYIYVYKNEETVGYVLENIRPFSMDVPLKIKKWSDGLYIEYEHFDLQCLKINNSFNSIRGYKAWGVLVEDAVYSETEINEYFEMMINFREIGKVSLI